MHGLACEVAYPSVRNPVSIHPDYPGTGRDVRTAYGGGKRETYRLSSSVSNVRSRSLSEYHGFRSFALGASATPFSVSIGPAFGFICFVDRTGICTIVCWFRVSPNLPLPTHKRGGEGRTRSRSSKRLMCPLVVVRLDGPAMALALAAEAADSAAAASRCAIARSRSSPSRSFTRLPFDPEPESPARCRRRSIRASESCALCQLSAQLSK